MKNFMLDFCFFFRKIKSPPKTKWISFLFISETHTKKIGSKTKLFSCLVHIDKSEMEKNLFKKNINKKNG